jgi:hypothetical protein
MAETMTNAMVSMQKGEACIVIKNALISTNYVFKELLKDTFYEELPCHLYK